MIVSEFHPTIPPADVLIVGTGPCGTTLAVELARKGVQVLLVDSGKAGFDSCQQALGDAEGCDGKVHAQMSLSTRRQLGGASIIWGGRCVPFDPVDLELRPFIAGAEWPITWDEVERYHEKTCQYFFCGRNVFDAQDLAHLEQKEIVPGFKVGDFTSSALERWSLPTNFWKEYGKEIKTSPNIHLFEGVTVREIDFIEDGRRAVGILGTSSSGHEVSLRAAQVVIAAGGLETTRILFCSDKNHPGGAGNHSDKLGRYYMGHVSGRLADVCFSTPPNCTRFNFEKDLDGSYIRRRFALTREAQIREELPNFAAWPVNPLFADPSHGNGILSFAALALASPFGKYFASDAIRRALIEGYTSERAVAHAWNICKDAPQTLAFMLSFGYRRFLPRRRLPGFFVRSKENRYPLQYHAEQVPNAESRVMLANIKDEIGMRRLKVEFKFAQQDVDGVLRSHELLDQQLRKDGVGYLAYHTENLAESVWDQAMDGYHQAGTTRMSANADEGVVDRDLRVHGINGLYVASSSIFPTSGQANSTFHAVALTLRLAEHLRHQVKR